MNPFIAIIILIVSILQIALFFKIWQMTNDTAEINKKFDVLLKKLESNSVKPIESELEKDLNSALDRNLDSVLESDLESGEYEANDSSDEDVIEDNMINKVGLPVIIAIIALIIFLILIAVLLA